jgi:hypothetical protein
MADTLKKLEKDLKEAKKVLENASVFMKLRAKKKVEKLEEKIAKLKKGNLPKSVKDTLRSYQSKLIENRQPELDAISPGPDPKPKAKPKTPPKPKPRPAAKTPPKPKPRPAAKKPAAKNSVTTTGGRPVTTTGGRPVTLEKSTAKKPTAKKSTAAAKKKAPGKFSEEAGKAFFKKLGIDAKYDDDDMPKRSSPERAKGGMVAKKKPVVAKKYGGMAVKKKAGGTVKKMCGGMAVKKGKK